MTSASPQKTPVPAAAMLLVIVRQIHGRLGRRQPVLDEAFEDARRFLDALPLASDEYSRAVNTLQNVRQYVAVNEFGAARYELTRLARQLHVLLNPPVRHPRRRRHCPPGPLGE